MSYGNRTLPGSHESGDEASYLITQAVTDDSQRQFKLYNNMLKYSQTSFFRHSHFPMKVHTCNQFTCFTEYLYG